MKIAYITDSMTTLTEEYRREHHIYILPVEIILDGVSYEDNVDITGETFYQNIESYSDLKTSQPSIGKMIAKFEELKAAGYEKIIVMALSSKGSGAYTTYCMAKDMVDMDIEVIDSLGASFIQDGLLQALIEKNENAEERKLHLEKSKFIVVPQDLKQLHKSGRVSGMAFLLASLLRIQPILEMINGEVLLKEKVRKKKEVAEYIFNQLGKAVIENDHLHLMHTGDMSQAEKWKEAILSKFPNLRITFSEVPVSVGVHNGRGTMIFSWFYA